MSCKKWMSCKNWIGLLGVLLAIGFLSDCGKSAAGYVERGNALFDQGNFPRRS
ncbi:MAG TPA: hypothetical protein VK776_24175 [Bryobacteraceae bacterium]|nr:hypothetical protein [Bryobacteraceae bacterium]